jgi:hypothetical protein
MLTNEDWQAVAADHAMTIAMLRSEIDVLTDRLRDYERRLEKIVQVVDDVLGTGSETALRPVWRLE